jgi:5-formyltetrahydrofolate cyclo-ligase
MEQKQSEKNRLRAGMKKSLKLSAAELAEKSSRLCAYVAAAEFWPRLSVAAAFLPLPGEPDLRPLLRQALREGKSVLLPRIDGEDLVFHEIRSMENGLVQHAYGMREPDPRLPLAEFSVLAETLFLVPGLAFSRGGHRLGRGRGFYDRFLRNLTARNRGGAPRPLILGTAFSCQILAAVPSDENDFPMPGLATENGIVFC